MIIRLKLLPGALIFLTVAMMPALLQAAQESARVEIERPSDWIILGFLAIVIIMFFLFRRMSVQQKSRRIMMHYLHNPDAQVYNPEFFKAVSYLAGHAKNYKNVRKYYEMWHEFSTEHPDKMHGLYAVSLLSASLAIKGLKEGESEDASELLRQSHAQLCRIPNLKASQSSFLKLMIAQGYMILASLADDEKSATPFFQQARSNLTGALNGDLQIFQMIGVLESLSALYQAIAEKSDAPLPYFKQALDYLHMALALNPASRTVFPALGALCVKWFKHEDDEQAKNRLQEIARQCRLAGYELEPFEKDMWLLRLSVIMNNEKTVQTKLGEMLDVQEEELYDAMRVDPYLERFRELPWFQRIMAQARPYRRQR